MRIKKIYMLFLIFIGAFVFYSISFENNVVIGRSEKKVIVIDPKAGSDSGKIISRNFANYSYNPNGICGSVASANYLQYYDDYDDDNIIPEYNEYNENGILSVLITYIEGISDFTTKTRSSNYQVKNGINNYLSDQNVNRFVDIYSYSSIAIKQNINRNKPIITLLNDDPTYGSHWVLIIGYYAYLGVVQGVYLVDGWGNLGVYFINLYSISSIIY
jgi:hypothetical protein